MQLGALERDLWEAEGEEDAQSSGYEGLHSSITTTITTSTAATSTSAAAAQEEESVGTATPETDTGTDFGLLRSYNKGTRENDPHNYSND